MTSKNLLAAACSLAIAMMAGNAAAQQNGNGDMRQARGERPELRLNTVPVQNAVPSTGASHDRRAELHQDAREIRGDNREIRSDRREIAQDRAEIRHDNRVISQARNELREDEMQRRQHITGMREAARTGDRSDFIAHREAVRRENTEIRSDRQVLHHAYAEHNRDVRELRHDQRELHRDRMERRSDVREFNRDRREVRHDGRIGHSGMNAGHGPSQTHAFHGNSPARIDHGVPRGIGGQSGHAGGMRMAHNQRMSLRR